MYWTVAIFHVASSKLVAGSGRRKGFSSSNADARLPSFFSGVKIASEDKVSIIDAAVRLNESKRDDEREEIKKEIVSIISKYC